MPSCWKTHENDSGFQSCNRCQALIKFWQPNQDKKFTWTVEFIQANLQKKNDVSVGPLDFSIWQSIVPFFFSKYADTSRDGSNINTVKDVESSAQCAVMCNEDKRCMAWSYERNTCYLKDNMPLHAYRAGVTSGETVSLSSSALKRRVIDHFQLFSTISYSFFSPAESWNTVTADQGDSYEM